MTKPFVITNPAEPDAEGSDALILEMVFEDGTTDILKRIAPGESYGYEFSGSEMYILRPENP